MEPTERLEMITATSIYCVSSASMMLSNKLAIQEFPLECCLVWLQLAFSALMLAIFAYPYIHVGSFKDLLRWGMVAPMYCAMLLTSILALKSAPMSLVIVIRNASPLGTVVIERMYPEPLQVSWKMLLAMVLMLTGAMMYMADRKEAVNWHAIGWVVLNSAIAVVDRLLQRLLLAKDQCPVDISRTGITFINNFSGVLVIGIAILMKGELVAVPDAAKHLTPFGMGNLLFSCILGLTISYTSIWAQSLITATSFLVMTNANKFVILAVEAWGLQTGMTSWQIAGASLSIVAGVFYGKAREEIEQKGERSMLLPGAKTARQWAKQPGTAWDHVYITHIAHTVLQVRFASKLSTSNIASTLISEIRNISAIRSRDSFVSSLLKKDCCCVPRGKKGTCCMLHHAALC